MKINLIILAIIISALISWALYADNKSTPNLDITPTLTETENLAPDFNYTTLANRKGSLHGHKGKMVLLHFWASWCAPCVTEFPELLKLAHKHQDNFILLAVSKDQNKQAMTRFIENIEENIPKNVYLIQDKEEKISLGLYKTRKLPETYVISVDSIILEKIVGPRDDWDSRVWTRKILNTHRE